MQDRAPATAGSLSVTPADIRPTTMPPTKNEEANHDQEQKEPTPCGPFE